MLLYWMPFALLMTWNTYANAQFQLEFDEDITDWSNTRRLYDEIGDAIRQRDEQAMTSLLKDLIQSIPGRMPNNTETTSECVYAKNAWRGSAVIVTEEPIRMLPCIPVESKYKPPGMNEIMVHKDHTWNSQAVIFGSHTDPLMDRFAEYNQEHLVSIPNADYNITRLARKSDISILFGRVWNNRKGQRNFYELRIYAAFMVDSDCRIVHEHVAMHKCANCPNLLARLNSTKAMGFC